ncbi:MAG: hypothetical protein U1E34_10260 [Amaricoccus sp.]
MQTVLAFVGAVILVAILGLAFEAQPIAAQSSSCNPAVQHCS